MKVKYKCDFCGKEYETEKEALSCEEAHEEKRLAREKLKEEQKADYEEITTMAKALIKLIKAYEKKYKESPLSVSGFSFPHFYDSWSWFF